jgi:methyl-accepting chemotaxis protein
VTKAITQLDSVIQQNSAASEELAASAEELSGQAVGLQEAMSYFKLAGGESTETANTAGRLELEPKVARTALKLIRDRTDDSFEEF